MMNPVTTGETVVVEGVRYVVTHELTREQAEQRDQPYPQLARVMSELSQRRQLGLRRPKGKTQYFAVEFERNGRTWIDNVVSLGKL